MGAQTLVLLATLDVECVSVDHLGRASTEAFAHPDHDVIVSFPGLGELTGVRVLAELGDDRARFADARAVKSYAGSAPVTRASGRSISITHRKVKNVLAGVATLAGAVVAAMQIHGQAAMLRWLAAMYETTVAEASPSARPADRPPPRSGREA